MAARVEVIRVRDGLAFAPLLAAVRGEDVLVVVVVEVLVLVDVRLGHSSRDSILGDACEKRVAVRRRLRKVIRSRNDSTRQDRFDWSRGSRRPGFIYGDPVRAAHARSARLQRTRPNFYADKIAQRRHEFDM